MVNDDLLGLRITLDCDVESIEDIEYIERRGDEAVEGVETSIEVEACVGIEVIRDVIE